MIAGLPAVFMLVMTFWATIMNEMKFIKGDNMLLTVINSIVILIVLAVAIEGFVKFMQIGEEPGELAEA